MRTNVLTRPCLSLPKGCPISLFSFVYSCSVVQCWRCAVLRTSFLLSMHSHRESLIFLTRFQATSSLPVKESAHDLTCHYCVSHTQSSALSFVIKVSRSSKAFLYYENNNNALMGLVVHTYPSTHETEAGGFCKFEASLSELHSCSLDYIETSHLRTK